LGIGRKGRGGKDVEWYRGMGREARVSGVAQWLAAFVE